MKNYLIIYFLLLVSTVFSQNYFYSLEEKQTPPDTENPTAPLDLVATNITYTTVDLSWTASTDNVGVVNYKVLIYDSTNSLLKSTTITNTLSYTETQLSPKTIHHASVIAIDAASNESIESNLVTFTTKTYGPNMLDEVKYFDCYLLPITQKNQLQQALDTYGCVRLEKGDYSGAKITMTNNQSLYGHPFLTSVPDIDIAAGSANVHIESVRKTIIDFQGGAPIKGCIIKSISESFVTSTGGQIEDNLFVDILKTSINFNCSASGYFRNNQYYKHMIHTLSPQLVLRGNTTTPSYGNVHVWTNLLTPNGDAVILDTMEDIRFIGLDAEGWNIRNQQTVGALVYGRNIGKIKISDFGGGGAYAGDFEVPPFDIQADDLFFLNKAIGNAADYNSIARGNTSVFSVRAASRETYDLETGSTGTNFRSSFKDFDNFDDNFTFFNDVRVTATFTEPAIISKLTNQILDTKYKTISRPIHETLPNPTGENWATERIGKPDSRDYIQGLIDTNNIAELPEGIYYIGSTLNCNGNVGTEQGIIGQGTGKTVIVGLTDDFPLITLNQTSDQSLRYIFANLTLQGGSTGIYSPDEIRLIAGNNWKYLIFRNQAQGLHFRWNFGFDNNFLDHVNFVDCGIGVFQDTHPVNDFENPSYIDKTVFYKSQFINCGQAIRMRASRANNLNAWIDCNFDNNGFAVDVGGNNYPIFANCDFTNNGANSNGELTTGNEPSFYNCDFTGNNASFIFGSQTAFVEGCNFNDDITLFSNAVHHNGFQFVLNSKSNGALGGAKSNNDGVVINSYFPNDTQFNKLMVDIQDNIKTILIDAPVNPYPQFLIKR